MEILEAVGSYGIIGGAFLFMLHASRQDKKELMGFIKEQQSELSTISKTLTMLSEDMRDLRRSKGE